MKLTDGSYTIQTQLAPDTIHYRIILWNRDVIDEVLEFDCCGHSVEIFREIVAKKLENRSIGSWVLDQLVKQYEEERNSIN